jgi:hypothetical protein
LKLSRKKDLAVGSFMSGHALVFRSNPVIQLALTMKVVNGGLIDPDGGSVVLRVCSSFNSKFTIPEICNYRVIIK